MLHELSADHRMKAKYVLEASAWQLGPSQTSSLLDHNQYYSVQWVLSPLGPILWGSVQKSLPCGLRQLTLTLHLCLAHV